MGAKEMLAVVMMNPITYTKTFHSATGIFSQGVSDVKMFNKIKITHVY